MASFIRRLFLPLFIVTAITLAGSTVAPTQTPAPVRPPVKEVERPQDPEEKLVIETDLVPLRVTVTDQQGRSIRQLKKEDFKVYENGVEQTIDYFSSEKAPASWGLVLDRSGSMAGMIQDVYRAALHIIDEGTEQDEMFIVTFNDRAELIEDFTTDRHRLENSILGLRAGGSTALYDAVAFALDHIRQGKHKKRVLMVLTDGEDNMSQLKFRKLVARAEEEGVLIYTVGMFDAMDGMRRAMGGGGGASGELEKLAEVTGARAHFPTDIEGCRKSMREIAREVSQQYTLGYYPSDKAHDGKWRAIRIVVGQEAGKSKYVARTRSGYYAPKSGEAQKKKF